jgi:hypothetical protein
MFKRSSFCKADSPLCVEVALPETTARPVIVRNSDTGDLVTFTHAEWRTFVAGVKAGEFDLS